MSFQSCSHQQITGKNQTVVNVVTWKRYFNNSPVSVICGVYKSLSPFWYMLQAQKCKQHGRNSHKYWEFFPLYFASSVFVSHESSSVWSQGMRKFLVLLQREADITSSHSPLVNGYVESTTSPDYRLYQSSQK